MTEASTRKPSSRDASKRARQAARAEEGEGRIVADVPRSVYLAVRKHCLDNGIQMRALVLEMLREKGLAPK